MPQFCVATEVDIVEGQPRIDWIRSSSSSSRCISREIEQQQFVWSNSNLRNVSYILRADGEKK